jgi:hypothetical protein
MNPEAKLSEIAFKLNLFISWPTLVTKIFPAILGTYSILMCHETIRAMCLLEKARDRNFLWEIQFCIYHHGELRM